MLRNRVFVLGLAMLAALLYAGQGLADTSVSEDFTGTTTNNPWYFFNGACLTASTAVATGNPGTPPGCTVDSYYTEHLVGGFNGVSGSAQTLPDSSGEGALRFTNGCVYSGGCSSGGKSQNGAIISENTFSTGQGLDITFKTVTYRGDSGGANGDGADGISFFLMDGDATPNIGSWGGSLGYTCSNANVDYHGMVGAYLGLGIDEYGNFLNGTTNTLGESGTSATGDNTASGGGYKPNRIGIRGGGNIAWSWLDTNYSNYYPSTLTSSQQQAAVRATCKTGTLWDYSNPSSPENTGTSVQDYPAIAGAYKIVSSKIANEYSSGGYSRQNATPITYRLKITEDGLLSLSYSYNGGSWIGVIQNQNITASNGALPSSLRFGFAGSTGGSSNIHEILCFKATPATQSSSSTSGNQRESSKIQTGSQAYFAYYDPSDWTGRLTANELLTDASGNLSINPTANWDASCVLTGVPAGSTCPTTGATGQINAQSYQTGSGGRVILTWSGTGGIPFEYANLTSAEQAAIDAGDSSQTAYRVNYLRGDRSNEIQTNGTGLYRDRDAVLGDIVDSSPTWVGPPKLMAYSAYQTPATWKDRLYPTTTMPENSGQTYSQFENTLGMETRTNVVYIGSNDGMVHGFSGGAYDSTDTTYNNTSNTGQELLAFMPQGVLQTIHNSSNEELDYSNTQYGHNFYVDAAPGVGDLYYSGAWHTWLVGGLGPGGQEIYALDVTDPTTFSESISAAANTVMGDWIGGTSTSNPGSFTCTNNANCALSLGDTYGTPQIRRLHNGMWGAIFGNGIGSSTGDAGIFILMVDPNTGAKSMYYLSTGVTGSNGIAYVMPVDLDGDHVTDYVYAGDLKGNVWRFDLTSNSSASWTVDGPIFTTQTGQPITSVVDPVFVSNSGAGAQIMLLFGTGEKFPLTNTSATSYQSGAQSYYGVWDWNMSSWNAHNLTQFDSLSASASGLPSPYTLTASNLQQQAVTIASDGSRSITSPSPVCWKGSSTCTSGNTQFGWYINLPGTNSAFGTTTYEQVIYNSLIVSTAVVFNTVLPAVDSPLACTPDTDNGFTYALDAGTGQPVSNFFNNSSYYTVGLDTGATGTGFEATTTGTGNNTLYWLVFQTTNGGSAGGGSGSGGSGGPSDCAYAGTGVVCGVNPLNNISGSRETWIQLR
jgi:type IV pilus assembly protein PilY1